MDTPVLANQQKTYIHQLCVVTGSRQEDLPRVMTAKDRWQVQHTMMKMRKTLNTFTFQFGTTSEHIKYIQQVQSEFHNCTLL